MSKKVKYVETSDGYKWSAEAIELQQAELNAVRAQRDRAQVELERRGAVAALREAADGLDASAASGLAWAPLHKDYSAWLRARADRIEGGES